MRNIRSSALAAAAAACLALATGSCGSKSPSNQARPPVAAKYNPETGRLTALTSDRNNDGKIDTWATMDGSRVVRIEIDEDGDGKVDRWEYYRPGTGSGANGVLERVERATRHDGRISRREFLEDGRLTRIEEDTDGDGAIDKWEFYRDGALVSMELDTQHRGKPDRRLVYGPGGALERIEVDPDGTGQFRPLSGR